MQLVLSFEPPPPTLITRNLKIRILPKFLSVLTVRPSMWPLYLIATFTSLDAFLSMSVRVRSLEFWNTSNVVDRASEDQRLNKQVDQYWSEVCGKI